MVAIIRQQVRLMQPSLRVRVMKKNIFRLSPGFCFADGLASLALFWQGMKDGSGDGVFYWNVAGAALCYLAAEGIVYYLITLGLELVPPNKITVLAIGEFWKSTRKHFRRTSSSYTEPLLESSSKYVDLDLNDDVDVQAERSRVLSGSMDKAIIYLRNLRKVYPGWNYHGTKVAVHSLTFAVQEGECFGFLGTNGAGKTTTLSMLSGEVRPSDGNAFIYGKDISSNPKAAHRHVSDWLLPTV